MPAKEKEEKPKKPKESQEPEPQPPPAPKELNREQLENLRRKLQKRFH